MRRAEKRVPAQAASVDALQFVVLGCTPQAKGGGVRADREDQRHQHREKAPKLTGQLAHEDKVPDYRKRRQRPEGVVIVTQRSSGLGRIRAKSDYERKLPVTGYRGRGLEPKSVKCCSLKAAPRACSEVTS